MSSNQFFLVVAAVSIGTDQLVRESSLPLPNLFSASRDAFGQLVIVMGTLSLVMLGFFGFICLNP
jgi:hypothetical protein